MKSEIVDNRSAFARTGTVLPTSQGNTSRQLAEYALIKLRGMGYNVDFDICHNNGEGSFAIHEFCGALGGVSIRYMHYDTHMTVLRAAMQHKPANLIDYCEQIRSSVTPDKYKLRRSMKHPEVVAFLAGSNCMRIAIDFLKVNECVLKEGGMVKPHPVTHERHMAELEAEYPNHVFAARVAGGSLIPSLKKAYIPNTSELNFIAIANGVSVVDITNHKDWSDYQSCYASYVDLLLDGGVLPPQQALNRMFSSDLSGLFFSKEDIDKNIMKYVEAVENVTGESLRKIVE
ncbi:hypothetical protein [Vibrio parahaemolyticus]|uniref:hypothetical protein n=1 Tax=Vibrio parahaemolyticus TaxID=670 RepID=UPI003D81380E